jgi:hypothetical protein
MLKRLWPASVLVSALLLAATSLHATEALQRTPEVQKARGPVSTLPGPGIPPIAGPAQPGDDDTPNRGGSPSEGGSDPSLQGSTSRAPEQPGWRWSHLAAGLHQRWVLVVRSFRW